MTEQQFMIVGAAMCGALLILAFAVLRLLRQLANLKQAHDELSRQVLRGDGDIAGLCSAAIAVDRRLADNEIKLDVLAQNIDRQQAPPAPIKNDEPPVLEGYAKAIQMILHGATAEELVKSFGMSRDEALLLISMNRSKDLPSQG